MNPRFKLKFVAFAALIAALVSWKAEASLAQGGPNVIIIMADDMGYGGVSCYDNQNFKTPEIDRLCKKGIKLTDFHSNGNNCSPTRAALMTGRYQQRTGCDGVLNASPDHPMHQVGIHAKEWTFAEAMKSQGYATGIFGKWHLGYKPEFNPTLHGFDEFRGFTSGNIDAHSHLDRVKAQDWWQDVELKDEPGYHTDLINRHAVDFIQRHKAEPFFLYVSHGAPHSPHQARGSKIQRGPDKGKLPPWAPVETYSNTPGADDWLIRHFISPIDEGVGQIRAKLEELGIADNTVIWFLSDNGGTGGNKTTSKLTRGAKGGFFEGGHRVPGMVWAPGRVKPGLVSDELIMTFDIMPTTMAMVGAESPADHKMDGIDVSSVILRNETLPPTIRFWSRDNNGALRDGNWKLYVSGKKDQLFNLAADSAETNNLAAKHPERVAKMRSIYDAMLAETLADSPYPKPAKSSAEAEGSKREKRKRRKDDVPEE